MVIELSPSWMVTLKSGSPVTVSEGKISKVLLSKVTVCGSLFLISVKVGCCIFGMLLLLCVVIGLLGVVLAFGVDIGLLGVVLVFGVVTNFCLFLLTGSWRTGLNDCPGRDGKSNWGNPDLKEGKGDKILSGGVNLLDGGGGGIF